MVTIADTVSRVRNILKAVKEDAFLTDRMIYSVVLKYGKLFVQKQDNDNRIMRFQTLFEVLPCVELIEVDKVEACCAGIKSKCIIKRTKDKLPTPMEGAYGPLFRDITSIDGSQMTYKTYPGTYLALTNSTNFKYNKTQYYWFMDGHLYFPNVEWDAVRIEAIWDDDIMYLKCNNPEDECQLRQDMPTNIPDYLFAEIEQQVLKEFGMMLQITQETKDDSQNIIRS
jgi:hypothetical protein